MCLGLGCLGGCCCLLIGVVGLLGYLGCLDDHIVGFLVMSLGWFAAAFLVAVGLLVWMRFGLSLFACFDVVLC